MLYKERRPKFISACTIESNEASQLGAISAQRYTGYCSACNKPIGDHKIINGQFICPGSYIIYERNKIINVMSKENFEELYTPLYEEEN